MWMLHGYALKRVYLSAVIRTGYLDVVLRKAEHLVSYFLRFPQDDSLMTLMCLIESGEFLVAYLM